MTKMKSTLPPKGPDEKGRFEGVEFRDSQGAGTSSGGVNRERMASTSMSFFTGFCKMQCLGFWATRFRSSRDELWAV